VDKRRAIREFLSSRRARISPEQANLPAYGDNRRVPGLRREEVALLAGVSVDYYTRLERGNLNGVSDSVLESISRALQLDEAERGHLFDLARVAGTISRARDGLEPRRITPSLQRVLDVMTAAPALIRNARMDYLATNRLGYALYCEMFTDATLPANSARFVFIDPRSRGLLVDWERSATEMVATLRTEVGRNPHDRGLSDLVGELSTRSEFFRTQWAMHDVSIHRTGFKRLHHPVVGDLELTYEAMEFPADPGLTMFAYTAEPGSASEEALHRLASWAATLNHVDPLRTAHAIDRE
jgi:transcriptional regulator with XRE-family HTH domain